MKCLKEFGSNNCDTKETILNAGKIFCKAASDPENSDDVYDTPRKAYLFQGLLAAQWGAELP
ncbi:uncharacterized protein N7446_008348 [Penicillium canescens]|uniref:Uncharacterized protein n=1 Tax=Penicillium canescens TaxID=5083 RepID=A0AAD6NDX6_PENCN|nr:uncharacterized protein N7446_008348 [Penicillium canescens]KAJ6033362.1 hypothetical protein N7444_011133 [Penicillium canescens]KAJ6057448.1 hypothetical protein N7460_000722 [Penicillium canescens]KAJ6058765.1 hypothetical protein N7446_008348 [Penicillium canescens]